jgi:hypothetical protein
LAPSCVSNGSHTGFVESSFIKEASFTFSGHSVNFKNMKRRDFLEKWGLSKLKINVKFLEAEFDPRDPDREAAWELYIELLTRVTTQYLPPEDGDEKAALDSIYAIFPLTREILRRRGSGCGEFAKLAIPVLNQVIRPFTAKWHRLSLAGAFKEKVGCDDFRNELAALQPYLRSYTTALAAMAAVEDLTWLEQT